MIPVEKLASKLGISHTKRNDAIQDNIDACILDMRRVGVNVNSETSNKLVDKAVELYCKADFNYQGKSEDFRKNYEKLRDAMSLCEELLKEQNEGDA